MYNVPLNNKTTTNHIGICMSSTLPIDPLTYVCALIVLHMMKGVVLSKASFWFWINGKLSLGMSN